jgi:hypothetical protein
MNGLLANPVISGLLSGGPNAIRAAAEQQRLALAPRGGGGMSGAPGAIVTQDRSGADLGAGLAGLGKGLSAIGKMRADAKRQEVEDQAIAQYLGQVNDPVQKERLTTLAGTPEGRQAIMAGVAKQAFPSAAGPLKAGDLVTVQTPNGPRFVQANDAIGQQPVAKEQAGDKLRLWYGDRSVDVTPGSDMEQAIPFLRIQRYADCGAGRQGRVRRQRARPRAGHCVQDFRHPGGAAHWRTAATIPVGDVGVEPGASDPRRERTT